MCSGKDSAVVLCRKPLPTQDLKPYGSIFAQSPCLLPSFLCSPIALAASGRHSILGQGVFSHTETVFGTDESVLFIFPDAFWC
jgi:hypothetical protein